MDLELVSIGDVIVDDNGVYIDIFCFIKLYKVCFVKGKVFSMVEWCG